MDHLRELSLFTGAGGGLQASALLGWRTVCAVENNKYCQRVLLARQGDGSLPAFPIWDDVRSFDGGPWRGRVDVISGGFPCTDISGAGKKEGIDGEHSGLWREMARIICEVEPVFVFVENSAALTVRGLDRVLGDLATMGFDARWCVLGGSSVGAPHDRNRLWLLAHKPRQPGLCDLLSDRLSTWRTSRFEIDSGNNRAENSATDNITALEMANAHSIRQLQLQGSEQDGWGWLVHGHQALGAGDWSVDPSSLPATCKSFVGRVADGVGSRMDRYKAIGNGQIPAVAALAWITLGGPL